METAFRHFVPFEVNSSKGATHTDCCRTQKAHLLFASGLNSFSNMSECAARCSQTAGCNIFLHSNSYGRCYLCSDCDVHVPPQPHAHKYSVYQALRSSATKPDPMQFASSFGLFFSTAEERAQVQLLASLARRVAGRGAILLIGDSQLRNQFLALARQLLGVPRELPLARALYSTNTAFSLNGGAFDPARMRKSSDAEYSDTNGYFWHRHHFLLARSATNLTLAFVKMLYECDGLSTALSLAELKLRPLAAWPPSAIVWNFGLWFLHISNASPKEVDARVMHCSAAYGEMVGRSVATLAAAAPEAVLVWRTNNAVCESLFQDKWDEVRSAFACARTTCDSRVKEQTRRACETRFNLSEVQCQKLLLSGYATRLQRDTSLDALQRMEPVRRVEVLDAFAASYGHCNASYDGRHFPHLLGAFNSKLMSLVLKSGKQ